MIPRVTLGGVPLNVPAEGVGWTFTRGPQPFIRSFVMEKDRARRVIEAADAAGWPDFAGTVPKGIELVVEGGGKTLRVKRLLVIRSRKGRNENWRVVEVADRRWLLQFLLAEGSFNIRVRTGELRVFNDELTPLEVTEAGAVVGYREPSLNELVPWVPKAALKRVLKDLFGPNGVVIDDKHLPLQDTIESFELRDPGPAAIDRTLGWLPGTTIWCDAEGRIRTETTLGGSELAELKKIGQGYRDRTSWEVVDYSRWRPKKFKIVRPRELEVRWDFVEQGGTRTAGDPYLENVLKCPDPELVLANGKKVHAGEWITVDAALEAWNRDRPSGAPELTQSALRRYGLAGLGRVFMPLYCARYGVGDIVWTRRISALIEHWRQTFRITRRWRSSIRGLKALRAALLDPTSGTRAQSDVYCDYVARPSARGLAELGMTHAGWNVEGYAELIKDAKVSPFEITVLDSELGVFKASPRTDAWGFNSSVQPGYVEGGFPDLKGGAAVASWAQVPLSSRFRLATILTCTQDAPANLGRLHATEITLAEAASQLPGSPQVKSRGVKEFVLADQMEPARFAWRDGSRAEILEAVAGGTPPPADLLLNPEAVGAASLALAARHLADRLDRAEGTHEGRFTPDVKPAGSIARVEHALRPEGGGWVLTTKAVMPPSSPITGGRGSLLSEGYRQILRGLVQ